MTKPKSTTVRILGEDGTPGNCPDLIIHLGGNGDYYIGTDGVDHGIVRPPLLARFCTSGQRYDAVTAAVVCLYRIGQAEREEALATARSLVRVLENECCRLPDSPAAEAEVRAVRKEQYDREAACAACQPTSLPKTTALVACVEQLFADDEAPEWHADIKAARAELVEASTALGWKPAPPLDLREAAFELTIKGLAALVHRDTEFADDDGRCSMFEAMRFFYEHDHSLEISAHEDACVALCAAGLLCEGDDSAIVTSFRTELGAKVWAYIADKEGPRDLEPKVETEPLPPGSIIVTDLPWEDVVKWVTDTKIRFEEMTGPEHLLTFGGPDVVLYDATAKPVDMDVQCAAEYHASEHGNLVVMVVEPNAKPSYPATFVPFFTSDASKHRGQGHTDAMRKVVSTLIDQLEARDKDSNR